MFKFTGKYFDNLKYTPRQATAIEMIALTSFCLVKKYGPGKGQYTTQACQAMETSVSEAAIAVFDNFAGNRYLMVIWEDTPRFQLLKWYKTYWQEIKRDGRISDIFRL